MEEKREIFTYTYSAAQQDEVKRIRGKYAMPEQENKMEQLRKLDRSVEKPGVVAAIIVGVLSALVFGIGMCCTMVWDGLMLPGIIIGVIGLIGMVAAYPLFLHITKQQRAKLAPEIIRLSDELMK